MAHVSTQRPSRSKRACDRGRHQLGVLWIIIFDRISVFWKSSQEVDARDYDVESRYVRLLTFALEMATRCWPG